MDLSAPNETTASSWEDTVTLAHEFAIEATQAMDDHRVAAAQVYASLAQTYATLAQSLVANGQLLRSQQATAPVSLKLKSDKKKKKSKKGSSVKR